MAAVPGGYSLFFAFTPFWWILEEGFICVFRFPKKRIDEYIFLPVGLEGWYEYKNAEYKRKKSILALSMMPGIKSLKDEIAKLDDGEEGVKKADIKNIGFSVKADGSVLFFAELEKSSTDQKKRIKQAREDKKAQKKEEEKGAKAKKLKEQQEDSVKRSVVRGDTASELVKSIQVVDWDKVAEEVRPRAGGRFDFEV